MKNPALIALDSTLDSPSHYVSDHTDDDVFTGSSEADENLDWSVAAPRRWRL